jgi:hypothetical protein
MKFKLKQEKLENLLEDLMVKDMIPSSIISVKEDKLFSVQREEHARALRFLNVKKSYFEEFLCDKEESIEINVPTVLGVVKKMTSDILTVETKDNRLLISGGNIKSRLTVQEPEGTVTKTFPFEMDGDMPLIGVDKIPLDTYISLDVSDLKEITEFGSSLKTVFYKFDIDDQKKIKIGVGDVLGVGNTVSSVPSSGRIEKGEKLSVVFSYAVSQVADIFQGEVSIKTSTNSPAWFYEETDDYLLGILVPPYIDDEE